jgi:hypothetical protein
MNIGQHVSGSTSSSQKSYSVTATRICTAVYVAAGRKKAVSCSQPYLKRQPRRCNDATQQQQEEEEEEEQEQHVRVRELLGGYRSSVYHSPDVLERSSGELSRGTPVRGERAGVDRRRTQHMQLACAAPMMNAKRAGVQYVTKSSPCAQRDRPRCDRSDRGVLRVCREAPAERVQAGRSVRVAPQVLSVSSDRGRDFLE